MKLIEIINKRCNCKVIHVVIKSKIGERVAYRNVCEDDSLYRFCELASI